MVAFGKMNLVFDCEKYWKGENYMQKYIMEYTAGEGTQILNPPKFSPDGIVQKDLKVKF
jgi:rRNA maturation protein Nop10